MPGGFGSRAATATPVKVPGATGGFGSRGGSTVKVTAAAGGGFGSRVIAAPAKSGGGGLLGDIEGVGHVLAKTGTGLASDAYNLPGGVYQLGKITGTDLGARVGNVLGLVSDKTEQKDAAAANALGNAVLHQTENTAQHPLAHPDQTLLNILPLLTGGASAIARMGAASDALEAGGSLGDVAKAVVAKPEIAPRILTVGEKQVPLHPSSSPFVRNIVQAPLDKLLQGAIDKNPEGNLSLKPGSGPLGLASYATKRIGNSLAETRRYQEAMTAAPAQRLATEGAALGGKVAGTIRGKAEQAALRLTSENRTPEGQIALHTDELAKVRSGESTADPKDLLGQIKLMKQVIAKGLVTKDGDGNTVINAADHPALARVDAMLAKGGAERDQILSDTGQMNEAGLETRRNAPAQVQAGAKFNDKPIPDAAKEAAILEDRGQLSLAPRTPDEAVGQGFVGGNEALPGRNYVPSYSTEARGSSGAITRSPSSVVGKAKALVTKSAKPYTGESLTSGRIPDNTTGLVARQMQRAYRYATTDHFRRDIATAGSKTRRTARDVLVNTQELKNAHVPDEIQAELGNKKLTLDELSGHQSAFEAWRQNLIPGLADKYGKEKALTEAPKGYVFVDRNLLADLGKPGFAPMGKVWKGIDTVNAAQTAATVYFKLGHVATRAFTNAATNIIQGSATPLNITKAFDLWKSLSTADRDRALAAAGQGGINALPHEGENIIGAVARTGAKFWSHRFDQPFRFNSIAYEARKAGYDTPAKFTKMLDDLQHPDGLPINERAKIEGVAKRANREGISYDRLNETERRYISRGIWFYPWVKGATAFFGHTLLDHPYKAAIGGNVGELGTRQAQHDLGAVPSYEQGLFKVGGSDISPFVANLNTMSPYATGAQILDTAANLNHPTQAEQFSNYLSPALAALTRAAFHLDSFGSPSKKGVLSNVASGFAATTPEEALLAALTAHGNQSGRLFPTSPLHGFTLGDLLHNYGVRKFLVGSATPRTMNRPVANVDAIKELRAAGRR